LLLGGGWDGLIKSNGLGTPKGGFGEQSGRKKSTGIERDLMAGSMREEEDWGGETAAGGGSFFIF